MLILLSPAKKMNIDTDTLPYQNLPQFLAKTKQLLAVMKNMSKDELKKIWKCSDTLTDLNIKRLEMMDLEKSLTPAILSYEGIQYQYMGPGIFNEEEYTYIQDHLRIASGFYGILRSFDGVKPYRLEMQAKLTVGQSKNLYDFWGDHIARQMEKESDTIINLASKEYSQVVEKHLSRKKGFITCIFAEKKEGKIIEKGTFCKMARGQMVRFMAENRIQNKEDLWHFNDLGYSFSKKDSDDSCYVYLKKQDIKG